MIHQGANLHVLQANLSCIHGNAAQRWYLLFMKEALGLCCPAVGWEGMMDPKTDPLHTHGVNHFLPPFELSRVSVMSL